MAYTISGNLNSPAHTLVIDQSTWSIESVVLNSVGAYTMSSGITNGEKLVIGREVGTGYVIAFGNVYPIETDSFPGNIGLFGGNVDEEYFVCSLEYIAIPLAGNSVAFGDLAVARYAPGATSNGTGNRGVWAGGAGDATFMDYVNMSATGNATYFGELPVGASDKSAVSNKTNNRGLFIGGSTYIMEFPNFLPFNTIDYVTINSAGNATDFGDINGAKLGMATVSNGANNRGVISGGHDQDMNSHNVIDYVTISTTGNASDFGDLLDVRTVAAGVDSGTNDRGLFTAGYRPDGEGDFIFFNTIEYLTISTTGNAVSFGEIIGNSRGVAMGVSNGTGNIGVFTLYNYMESELGWYESVNIATLGNSVDSGYITTNYLIPGAAAGASNA